MHYHRPGDEATELNILVWAADEKLIALVQESKDNICARAILYGLHESLARVIANMSPQARERTLSAISHESDIYGQSHDSCSQSHQTLVECTIQEWVEELRTKVTHHASNL